MDIGEKIRNARKESTYTQERVAEILGVSRQTISSWENDKSYPDIISVIKMSDLYQVSLDYLLKGERIPKEESPMKNYLEYLEESTNTVKSNERKTQTILYAVYLAVCAIAVLVFWMFTEPIDAMGYGLIYMWMVLPITNFVVSLLFAKNNFWGKAKWVFALVMGLTYMLSDYVTFSLLNMLTFSKFNAPELGLIVSGGIISLIGLRIGHLIYRKRNKKEHERI